MKGNQTPPAQSGVIHMSREGGLFTLESCLILPRPMEAVFPFFADAGKTAMWLRYRDRDLPEAPADFSAVGVQLRDFLIEPLRMPAGNAPFASTWQPGGPWR